MEMQNLPTILNWLLFTFLVCGWIKLHKMKAKARKDLNEALELVKDARLLNEEIAPVREDFFEYLRFKKGMENMPEVKKEILQ